MEKYRPSFFFVDNLGGAVETYLSSHFAGFPNGMPPPGLYHRILKEIEVLVTDPRPSGVVKLEGAADLWRIRVGQWRVV